MGKTGVPGKTSTWQLFISIAFFSITSCTQSTSAPVMVGQKPHLAKPPSVVEAGQPFVVKLDTCLPPLSVALIDNDSLWIEVPGKGEKTRIKISKLEIRAADFFIPMQTYNMEKGLIINSVGLL